MAKSKKPKPSEFVTGWKNQIESGLEYRKKYSTFNKWSAYRQYYRGNWAPGIIPINKIFSYGRLLLPRVYFRAPRVTITAMHPDLVAHASVLETVDNHLIQTILLKEIIKGAILDGFLCGVGPIKLGYDSEFGYHPEQAVLDAGETITQLAKDKESERIEYNSSIKPGMPWAERTRPEDVVVPWGADNPNALPWIAHYILRPIEDIKQDAKYQNTKDLQGTRYPLMGDRQDKASLRPRTAEDKNTVYGELWEVRDVKTKQVMTFCEDQLILSAPDPLQTVEGLPWEFVTFNPDPEYFWAIPDAHILMPQQEELNETYTQESQHRKISLLKFLYKKGALTQVQLDHFLSGQVGPAVELSEDVENILNAIHILQPHVPPELRAVCMEHIQAMREELGFSQNQEGSFSPYHGKTASESMIVAESFEQRVDERRDHISDIIARIVRKWNQMLFTFWTEERVIQMVGPSGQLDWVTFTGDQLKGAYQISVHTDSGMPITKALKHDMGIELMKTFGGDELMDQMLLRQIVLDTYRDVDPRVPQLIQPSFAGPEQVMSKMRQPGPAFGAGAGGGAGGSPNLAGAGKGAGGGMPPSSPSKPQAFDAFKKRVTGR